MYLSTLYTRVPKSWAMSPKIIATLATIQTLLIYRPQPITTRIETINPRRIAMFTGTPKTMFKLLRNLSLTPGVWVLTLIHGA